ncbi:MAG: carboxymuconolactone decarboxylase family protein [Thiomonas sp.]
MTQTPMHDRLHEVEALVNTLGKSHPNEVQAFMNFMGKAESGPALSSKEKELVNVALSVAAQCEWCIAFHVKHAVHAGAKRDELIEAGFLAVLMHGGPAMMYMTPLLQAIDEFAGSSSAAA